MSRPTFLNRTRLPPEAFRCAECSAVAGKCEHTDPKTNPRYKVVVAGILEARREPMDEMFVLGPLTPEPMKMPSGKVFFLED